MSKCLIKNKIRVLRFMNNEMTQQELADITGVSRQTIVAVEKGKYSPSLDLAFRISNEFSVPFEEVFTYEMIEEKKNSTSMEKGVEE